MNIFVVGKPGAGKSLAAQQLSDLFTDQTFAVEYFSDRQLIEDLVRIDTAAKPEVDGWLVGDHSRAQYKPDGSLVMHALDGHLWNSAHVSMMGRAGEPHGANQIRIMEYAIGPTVPFEGRVPLFQDAASFVGLMRRHRATGSSVVLDIESNFAYRLDRNNQRPDKMDENTFKMYFPDKGEFGFLHRFALGSRYRRILNNSTDARYFSEQIQASFDQWLLPSLREDTTPDTIWAYRR
jgi:hypothetical protein